MTAYEMLLEGDAWTDEIARYAMPILLWCAQNGTKITYGDLEAEMIIRHKIDFQQVKTKYGFPAGKVGYVINELSEEVDEDIPPINAIICRKDTGLPSKGVDWFIKKFLRDTSKKRMSKANRDELTKEVIESVLTFPSWDIVAKHLGYDELPPVSVIRKKDSSPIVVPSPQAPKGGGESEKHKKLKEKMAVSPELFRGFGKFRKGVTEYSLRSGDKVDVIFRSDTETLAVEVKADNANESELVRGIYQCVKYRATLRAMQLADGELPNAQSVLATAIPLVGELKRLAKRLNVHWIHAK